MRRSIFCAGIALLLACGGSVDVGSIAGKPDSAAGDAATDAGAIDPVSGMPCSSLHGTTTLGLRSVHGWPACAFSFRFASRDPKITQNTYDVELDDVFIVNLVTGDQGWLVDLGDVPLTNLPKTVDPAPFPTGQWGEHDALDPVLNHTYFARIQRTAGNTLAAFRVVELSPTDHAKIEWVRSPDPDTMVVPTACAP